MKIHISTMNFEDISSIETIFSESFDRFWSIDTLKNDFNNDTSKYIVAKIDDVVVGFAGIKTILNESDIMNIVVRTDRRRLGIGTMLLEKLIKISKESSCITINLEVNENNISAIRLYEKNGFERIGIRKKYYNNVDNAIIMKKNLINS